MDVEPPRKSVGREVVERIVEAALGSVPLAGPALAVGFVTALGWRLEQRRDKWFTQLAFALEEMRRRIGDLDFEKLADSPIFVDAVVTTSRIVEHTHQEEKIAALRNAVLNSVTPGAPDADTQAIFLTVVDRYTPSHLRLLAMLDDPHDWFSRHGLTLPVADANGARYISVEAALPELHGMQDFYRLLANELNASGLLAAELPGPVSAAYPMTRMTSDIGRQFVRFVSPSK
jgi:hypothetical protein